MPVLRTATAALKAALAAGNIPGQADLYTVTTASGTVYRWANWDLDLVVAGNTFVTSKPWLKRGKYKVSPTMVVETLDLQFFDNGLGPFGGGSNPSFRNQLINGLFDGATLKLQRVFMKTLGYVPDTTTYGTVNLFLGDMGTADANGPQVSYKVKSKVGRLLQMAPRNVFQPGCSHTFCDTGCTLNAATFTTTGLVVLTATKSQITVLGGVGSFPVKYGTLTMTSGTLNGLKKTIIDSQSVLLGTATQLTLATPFLTAPIPTDTFSVFASCDKLETTCSTVYSNLVNFRGFPWIPPPNTAAPGQ